MSKGVWGRWAVLWLLFALLVWAVAVGWWTVRDIQPTTRDLVLYLGVLPVGGFAVIALLVRAVRSATGRAQTSQTAAEGESPGAAADRGDALASGPQPSIALLAGAVTLPAGASPEAIEACCVEQSQPELHEALKDRDGFPVRVAWIDDLAVADIAQWLDARDDLVPGSHRPKIEQQRALAALQPVVQALAGRVLADGLLSGADPVPDTESARTPATPDPTLMARLWVPADWTPEARAVAVDWLLAELKDGGLPEAQVRASIEASSEVGPLLEYLDALAALPGNAQAPVYHLALACDSMLAPAGIERIQRQGGVLSSRQPEGLVPAEGASGMLAFAPGAVASNGPEAESFLRAHAIEPSGAALRTQAAVEAFSAVVTDALRRARIDGDEIGALVSDAGLRKSRAALVAGLASGGFSHLDLETDCLNIGVRNGALGPVGVLAMLAIASVRSKRDDSPVLVLNVSAADARAVFVVSPTGQPGSATSGEGEPASAA